MSTQSGLSRGSINEPKTCGLALYPSGQDAMGPRASPKSIPSIKITKVQKGFFGEVCISGASKKSVGYIPPALNVNNSPFAVNYGGLLSPQNRLSITGVKPESFSTDKLQSTNDITATSNRKSAKLQALVPPKLLYSPLPAQSGTLPATNLLSPAYKQAMGRTIMRVEKLIKKQCQNIVKLTEKKGSETQVLPQENLKTVAPQNTHNPTLSDISSIHNLENSYIEEVSILGDSPVKTQESQVHWINESLIRRCPTKAEDEESEGTICQDKSSRDTHEQIKHHLNLLDNSMRTCSSHSVTMELETSIMDPHVDKQKPITKIPLEKIDRRFSENVNESIRRPFGVGSDFRIITEDEWMKKAPKTDGLYVDSEILTPIEPKEDSMRLSKAKNLGPEITTFTRPEHSPKIPSNKILVRIIKSIKRLPETREQAAFHTISQESPKKLYTMISNKHELSKQSLLADQHKTANMDDGLRKMREIKKINLANIHNFKPRAPIRQVL